MSPQRQQVQAARRNLGLMQTFYRRPSKPLTPEEEEALEAALEAHLEDCLHLHDDIEGDTDGTD